MHPACASSTWVVACPSPGDKEGADREATGKDGEMLQSVRVRVLVVVAAVHCWYKPRPVVVVDVLVLMLALVVLT